MARAALILAILLLTGCQVMTASQIERFRAAAVDEGIARANANLPETLPADCTAHVDRVIPKRGEKWRWVNGRWEIVAEIRDDRADNCGAWWADYRGGINDETRFFQD